VLAFVNLARHAGTRSRHLAFRHPPPGLDRPVRACIDACSRDRKVAAPDAASHRCTPSPRPVAAL